MSHSEWLFLNLQSMLFVCNIAAVVLFVSIVGLFTAYLCRRSSAPVCHGMLLSTLLLMLAAPVLVCVDGVVAVGGIRVETTPFHVANSGRETSQADNKKAVVQDVSNLREVNSPKVLTPAERPLPVRRSGEPLNAEESTAGDNANTAPWWLVTGQLLLVLWAVGSAISLLLLGRGFIRLIRFRRGLTDNTSDRIIHAAARLAPQAGLSKPPRIYLSTKSLSPMTTGLFSPVIVLPETLESEFDAQQLDDVVLHEMAHVARHDHWVGLGQRLAVVLYWWCPLVYVINRHLRRLREDICDNYVLRQAVDGSRFAELLITLAERATFTPRLPVVIELFHKREHELERRVHRLLSEGTNLMTHTNFTARFLLLAFVASLGAVVSCLTVRADNRDATSIQVRQRPQDTRRTQTVAVESQPVGHTVPADTKAVIISLDYHGGDGPPRKRKNDEPYLKILADGTTVAGAPFGRMKRLTTKLTSRQVQELLRFALDEQRFRAIQSKDLGLPAGTISQGGQTATIRIHCDKKVHTVVFLPGVVTARAAKAGKASPVARILAIRQWLERVRAEMHAGGKSAIAAHLRTANAQLKVKHPNVPPLDADDLQSATTTAAGTRYVTFERNKKLKNGKTQVTMVRLQYRDAAAKPTVTVLVYKNG